MLEWTTGRVCNPQKVLDRSVPLWFNSCMDELPIIPLAKLEEIMIFRALARFPNKRDVCKALKIGRTTLYRKLAQYEREKAGKA